MLSCTLKPVFDYRCDIVMLNYRRLNETYSMKIVFRSKTPTGVEKILTSNSRLLLVYKRYLEPKNRPMSFISRLNSSSSRTNFIYILIHGPINSQNNISDHKRESFRIKERMHHYSKNLCVSLRVEFCCWELKRTLIHSLTLLQDRLLTLTRMVHVKGLVPIFLFFIQEIKDKNKRKGDWPF